jgi:hypothetical protein
MGALSALLAVNQAASTQPAPVGATGMLIAHHKPSSLLPTTLAVEPARMMEYTT